MATARKRTTVSNKGRVPGSGKNTKKKYFDGLPTRKTFVNRLGAEGPKRSMPRKKK